MSRLLTMICLLLAGNLAMAQDKGGTGPVLKDLRAILKNGEATNPAKIKTLIKTQGFDCTDDRVSVRGTKFLTCDYYEQDDNWPTVIIVTDQQSRLVSYLTREKLTLLPGTPSPHCGDANICFPATTSKALQPALYQSIRKFLNSAG